MPVIYHIPALLEATISALSIKADGKYVDVTFGGGGHSRAIFERLGESGRLYGFDQDADARNNAIDDKRFTFIHANFRYLDNFMRWYGESGDIDGIVADLGVSFHHFDTGERGFSFRMDGPLDMRMNQSAAQTAADIVNSYTEESLARVLRLYGELPNSGQIAKSIVKAREKKPLRTIGEFNEVVIPFCGRDREKKVLACIYQALRIETNDELGALRDLLESSLRVLKQGGRMAVLTYHSLEDRLVKNFFRSGNISGELEKDFYGNIVTPWQLVNNKVITASADEVAANPRSRSAKLRVAEKVFAGK